MNNVGGCSLVSAPVLLTSLQKELGEDGQRRVRSSSSPQDPVSELPDSV